MKKIMIITIIMFVFGISLIHGQTFEKRIVCSGQINPGGMPHGGWFTYELMRTYQGNTVQIAGPWQLYQVGTSFSEEIVDETQDGVVYTLVSTYRNNVMNEIETVTHTVSGPPYANKIYLGIAWGTGSEEYDPTQPGND